MTALEINTKYKLKGSAFKSLKNYLDLKIGSHFFPQACKEVGMQQRSMFLTSSWYPSDHYYAIVELARAELGFSAEAFMKDIAQSTVDADLNGIYKVFVKLLNPQIVLGKFQQLADTYTNYSSIVILINKTGLFKISVEMPVKYFDYAVHSFEGVIRAILKLCKTPMTSTELLERQEFMKDDEVFIRGVFEVKY